MNIFALSYFSGDEFDEEEVEQDIKEEVKEEGSESDCCGPNIIYKKWRQFGDGSKLNKYAYK